MANRLRVIMLGPDPHEQGGMGSVASLILNTPIPNIKIQYLSTWKAYSGKAKIGNLLHLIATFNQAFLSFLRLLLQGKVDVVHLHLSERGSALRVSIMMVFALIFRKPIIIHAHGCEFHEFHDNLAAPLKKSLDWLLQQCTYLIALSQSWQNYYIYHCGLKSSQVLLLNNPVQLPAQIPERQNRQQLNLVFLGRIIQRKGVYDLLHALARLSQESLGKIHLILAGSGEVDQAQALAQDLGIEPYISFPGWINPQEREQLLAQADIFLLPSYNEGLPMALLEAMSWGLAVITTPVGGSGEVVIHQQTGLLVNPGDRQGLADQLELLVNNESLRLKLGKNAREFVTPLDINNYNRSLANLYQLALRAAKSLAVEPSF
ncbi:MAG: glycosyltransferase family 4 protein [Microcystis aeruginosa K13-05]|jgi:glycosyltransferase involved in cell wall biosynthesis|uniref:Glycosyl transferase family 1 n=4 Tax=Microcystis TaxID=1125 RepID=A0A1V4BR03_MICAE|nr:MULTISPECIES: glycosyltransferase family 4 protein [Microcystis]MCE2661577.1 glycosyltransferase family 4 protein [Microcystis sp. 53602_E8]MCZ8365667.1 glycosyltransferase family 4 protein [Microcystis sp. LE19-251.1A]MDJ0565343.1 glycosyltransferase family 4 protein [Microcystis sp. M49629_WE12]NCR78788.1 glycosyltransferase family 4 protein [Microcystis aeruginosa K13-10]NCR83210.1 glycosyltransferase family 4 protein [Microcystis aeruginosa K13-05]